eukprot:COSAG01_NODE_178_length_22933_cov_18.398529_19_plen_88_part_00
MLLACGDGDTDGVACRSAKSTGLPRALLNLAMLFYSVLYIASAVQPANNASRYTYFGRAVLAALCTYVVDISVAWQPCPVSPMDVYR